MDAGKRGMISEPRSVRAWAEVPFDVRRSIEVRHRMRKRPVDKKSVVFVTGIFFSNIGAGY